MNRTGRRFRRIRPWWRRFKRNGYRRERCNYCRHPFRWQNDSRHSTGNRDGDVYHGPCLAAQSWRSKADERLRVLGVAVELSGLTSSDVQEAMSFRASDGKVDSGSQEWNVAWRVFYDLKRSTEIGRGEAS